MHADAQGDGDGLFYEDSLPLRWREIGPTVTPAQALNIQQSNEQILRNLAVVDEHRLDLAEEAHPQVIQELTRLDSKINLLLDMVGQLVSRQLELPEPVPVRLGPDRLQWISARSPSVGDRIAVEIYLNPRYPSAMTLLGTVAKVNAGADGFFVEMAYADGGEGQRNALEKLIFRRHRRSVAQARRPVKKPVS